MAKQNDNLDGVFLSAAKEFHDEYCSEDGPIFAMGAFLPRSDP
jgi:hypothetical protein